MKRFSVMVIAGLCAACSGGSPASTETGSALNGSAASTQGSAAVETASKPVEKVREITIPDGTPLRLDMKSSVGSDSSRVEESVRATLREPVVVKGETVLPVGTEVTGAVTDVERSGRVKGRARVAFRFTSLHVGGERYDIRTSAVSEQAAATKGDDAKKIAIGAGAGAALGAVLGGGGGAAKGAAIGGAGGTGVVLATRGKEVHLAPGANVTTRLTAPLTVRVRTPASAGRQAS